MELPLRIDWYQVKVRHTGVGVTVGTGVFGGGIGVGGTDKGLTIL